MQLELPKLIKEHLSRVGISRRELVERMGYRNVAKGMRYLMSWLRSEALPDEAHGERLATAMGMEPAELEEVLQRDVATVMAEARRRRALDRRFYLTIRYMPVVYGREILDEDVDEEQAVEIARARATRIQRRCWLNAPSNRVYSFDEKGELESVGEGAEPVMRIGGKRVRLWVGSASEPR